MCKCLSGYSFGPNTTFICEGLFTVISYTWSFFLGIVKCRSKCYVWNLLPESLLKHQYYHQLFIIYLFNWGWCHNASTVTPTQEQDSKYLTTPHHHRPPYTGRESCFIGIISLTYSYFTFIFHNFMPAVLTVPQISTSAWMTPFVALFLFAPTHQDLTSVNVKLGLHQLNQTWNPMRPTFVSVFEFIFCIKMQDVFWPQGADGKPLV